MNLRKSESLSNLKKGGFSQPAYTMRISPHPRLSQPQPNQNLKPTQMQSIDTSHQDRENGKKHTKSLASIDTNFIATARSTTLLNKNNRSHWCQSDICSPKSIGNQECDRTCVWQTKYNELSKELELKKQQYASQLKLFQKQIAMCKQQQQRIIPQQQLASNLQVQLQQADELVLTLKAQLLQALNFLEDFTHHIVIRKYFIICFLILLLLIVQQLKSVHTSTANYSFSGKGMPPRCQDDFRSRLNSLRGELKRHLPGFAISNCENASSLSQNQLNAFKKSNHLNQNEEEEMYIPAETKRLLQKIVDQRRNESQLDGSFSERQQVSQKQESIESIVFEFDDTFQQLTETNSLEIRENKKHKEVERRIEDKGDEQSLVHRDCLRRVEDKLNERLNKSMSPGNRKKEAEEGSKEKQNVQQSPYKQSHQGEQYLKELQQGYQETRCQNIQSRIFSAPIQGKKGEVESEMETGDHSRRNLNPKPPLDQKENRNPNKAGQQTFTNKNKARNIAEALFDFTAQKDCDLSFIKGDRIEVLKEKPNGWWVGKLQQKTGYFPFNFVRPINSINSEQ